jgi:hypothetical protein
MRHIRTSFCLLARASRRKRDLLDTRSEGTLTFMRIAPYGSWASVISVDQLIGSSIGLSAVQIDGEHLYWLESRADERGRTSLWRRPPSGGEPVEVTPRLATSAIGFTDTAAVEYHVSGGTAVYLNSATVVLYAIRGEGPPTPITRERFPIR